MSITGNEQNQGLQAPRRALFASAEQESQDRDTLYVPQVSNKVSIEAPGSMDSEVSIKVDDREEGPEFRSVPCNSIGALEGQDGLDDGRLGDEFPGKKAPGNGAPPPLEHFAGHSGERDGQSRPVKYHEAVRSFKRRLLSNALLRNKWNVSKTAAQLGIQRSHLYKLMDGHDLSRPEKPKD